MSDETFTIGALASAAAVNLESIRYYERLGLIKQPRKPVNGYRQYPHEFIKRIRFIKQAQVYGFSLKEVKDLLSMGDGRCHDVQNKAVEKREYISAQITDLKRLMTTLDELIESCRCNESGLACPIINTLGQPHEER
ncbi:hypothetical protein MNBD_GAMMA12-2781 [hydrothermal vent metagenome]|uniref:HTH merR-type domain-containing protein n=1 Tax=hydrothermal vent metagenome TaxID=652676 RepID=A0A3B0YEX9_9ZZZZ